MCLPRRLCVPQDVVRGLRALGPPIGRVEVWRRLPRGSVSSPRLVKSNGACGLPALRFAARFVPRLMELEFPRFGGYLLWPLER